MHKMIFIILLIGVLIFILLMNSHDGTHTMAVLTSVPVSQPISTISSSGNTVKVNSVIPIIQPSVSTQQPVNTGNIITTKTITPVVTTTSVTNTATGQSGKTVTVNNETPHLGCFQEELSGWDSTTNDWGNRILVNRLNGGNPGNTQFACENWAKENGYPYYGLEDGGQCFGGNLNRPLQDLTASSLCQPGGGINTLQLYGPVNV